MWFEPPEQLPDWSAAVRHLRKADPRLAAVIKRVGPCTLFPRPDPFASLCASIFTQQISTKIAAILFNRFRDLFPRKRITAPAVLKLFAATPREKLGCGLSQQKHSYLKDLAEHVADNRIPLKKLPAMSDEEVIEALTAVKGVGRWTAEMFLIFVLNRPDVWPVDDLGLQEGLREVFELPARPKPKDALPFGEKLRPWRSIATWYLWRRDSQSTPKASSPLPRTRGRGQGEGRNVG
jgi:DNA-3-methyladenine glycosylase II